LFRRALKPAALAVALLLPTLAGVATAPPAHAIGTDLGTFKGLSYTHAQWADGSHMDATASVDTVTPGTVIPADQSSWAYSPGSTFTVRVAWSTTGSPAGGHYISPFDQATVSLSLANGLSGVWPAGYNRGSLRTLTPAEQAAGLATFTVALDLGPFNGVTDQSLLGQVHVDFNLARSGADASCTDAHCTLTFNDTYGYTTTLVNTPSSGSFARSIFDGQGAILGQSNNTLTTNDAAIGGTSFQDGSFIAGSLNQLNSATANFTAADVGKAVTGKNIPASTTISSRNSATQVTLNHAATAAGTSLYFNVSGRGSFEFQAVRVFHTDFTGPTTAEKNLLSVDHRVVIYSFKPPTNPSCSSGLPRWQLLYDADCNGVADTTNVAALVSIIHDLQDAAAAGNTQAILTFGHEPHDEDDANDNGTNSSKCIQPGHTNPPVVTVPPHPQIQWCSGVASEYKAAYQLIRDALDANCVAPQFVDPCDRVLLSYTAVPSNMTGTDNYRLDDNIVDLWTPDPYNYFCYFGNSTSCDASGDWKSFQQAVSTSTDIMTLAKTHKKQMLFAEVGSHPGCPNGTSDPGCSLVKNPPPTGGIGAGTRGSWFTAMASYLKTNADAKQWILGFTYYTAGTNDWKFVDYGAPTGEYRGLAEYRTSFRDDSYFVKGATSQTAAPVWIAASH
jgi:hypothetical protein